MESVSLSLAVRHEHATPNSGLVRGRGSQRGLLTTCLCMGNCCSGSDHSPHPTTCFFYPEGDAKKHLPHYITFFSALMMLPKVQHYLLRGKAILYLLLSVTLSLSLRDTVKCYSRTPRSVRVNICLSYLPLLLYLLLCPTDLTDSTSRL